jgi:hypothetical protein
LMAAEWESLFDGKTLNGWEVHSGTATYKVEKGIMVGTVVLGSPNTFLCTKKEYGDFILEFEVNVDPGLNSGVQFRSQIADGHVSFKSNRNGVEVDEKLPADRVYGYQVEIADASSKASGNVYDEARRGRFLDDFTKRPQAQTAFKDGQWNKYKIECKGDSIKTWVNGIACADFRDSMTGRGIIGLQVHAVGKDRFKPFQVRWRNLRIRALN